MTCRDICLKYPKPSRYANYKGGRRYCTHCERAIMWQGLYCPCCGFKLRLKGRSRTARATRDRERKAY